MPRHIVVGSIVSVIASFAYRLSEMGSVVAAGLDIVRWDCAGPPSRPTTSVRIACRDPSSHCDGDSGRRQPFMPYTARTSSPPSGPEEGERRWRNGSASEPGVRGTTGIERG